MQALIVTNTHFNAWCRECAWHGPLRFKRELAAGDAVGHDLAKHADEIPDVEDGRREIADGIDGGFDRVAVFGGPGNDPRDEW